MSFEQRMESTEIAARRSLDKTGPYWHRAINLKVLKTEQRKMSFETQAPLTVSLKLSDLNNFTKLLVTINVVYGMAMFCD